MSLLSTLRCRPISRLRPTFLSDDAALRGLSRENASWGCRREYFLQHQSPKNEVTKCHTVSHVTRHNIVKNETLHSEKLPASHLIRRICSAAATTNRPADWGEIGDTTTRLILASPDDGLPLRRLIPGARRRFGGVRAPREQKPAPRLAEEGVPPNHFRPPP